MQTLFLSFDSSTSWVFFFNWVSVFFPLFFLSKFWVGFSQLQGLFYLLDSILVLEIKAIFSLTFSSGIYLMFVSLFFFVASMNLFGLLPYIFTASSHLVMTLFLSIPIWLGVQAAGWVFTFNKMACHLVPMSTPIALIPFLVLIESLSNVIRPFTLAVRLTANMMAGHLLMILLGSSIGVDSLVIIQVLGLAVMLLLLILEVSVAFIQSYVFMLLSSLYTVEAMV